MVQSPADENARLRQALEEKNQLVEKQNEIINQQLDMITDTAIKLKHAETQIHDLTVENTTLKTFRDKVHNTVIYRVLKWFKP